LNFHTLTSLAVVAYGVLAVVSPSDFFKAGFWGVAVAFAALAYLFPTTFLGFAILSLELGPENHLSFLEINQTRTLHRGLILLALGVNIWHFGWRLRSNPPIAALIMMFLVTLLAADFLPWLTGAQMIKSLISLCLPFLFLHCIYRREAIDRYLNCIAWMPLVSVALGMAFDVAGLRPAYRAEYTGAMRISGMTIPAYLGYFAYTGFFVSVYQLLVNGKRNQFWPAGINFLIIMLTGTRMPMAMAAVLGSVVLLIAPQRSLSMSTRVKVLFAGAILLCGAIYFVWPQIEARITGNAASLSGRDVIWEYYLLEIEKNPWFGRGIGAGVVLLPTIDDYRVAFTTAAHNEYLRVLIDSGIVGLTIFMIAMIYWVNYERRYMVKEESIMFISFMLLFAVASFVGNTLSSPYSLVIFFTLALIIQRSRQHVTELARWSHPRRMMTTAPGLATKPVPSQKAV
jgi:O-antigen ligase